MCYSLKQLKLDKIHRKSQKTHKYIWKLNIRTLFFSAPEIIYDKGKGFLIELLYLGSKLIS